ncbi:MAG TPA: lytic transglycosylase domain-containing protein [Candidatus Dormibacteraeota bacterium]|nr:lytic transglycosylase domain-containing protein [Candidatus Dormibacteraeota bacterium]
MLGALLLLALPAQSVHAQDPFSPVSPRHEAARLMSAELTMSAALAQRRQLLSAPAPTSLMDRVRLDLAVAKVDFTYRNAIRQEEIRVYELASYASVESQVIPLLPKSVSRPVSDAVAALHSLYALAGFDQYYLVHAHFVFPYANAAPVDALRGYYLEAQRKYGVDPSYLASINFIESSFGRNNGPSSAGALGPMQFLPGTWADWGQGGNINDPHDAILAAARYLVHYGAPGDMYTAIFHYNLDTDYVDAVESFALAIRQDPTWLDRLYYWGTSG